MEGKREELRVCGKGVIFREREKREEKKEEKRERKREGKRGMRN